MANFSASAAIGSGFRLIRRDPMALLWWAGAYLVLGVLPQVLVMGAALPDFIALYQQIGRDAVLGVNTSPDPASMLAMQSKMMALQPIMLASSLVSQTVLTGAIFRAVLTPEDRRGGYIRFSRQELWLGLAVAVLWVMMFLLVLAVFIPVGIMTVVMALRGDHAPPAAWDGLAIAAVVIAGLCVIGWVLLRLSLALPLSFATGRFLLFESWTLTQGHALKMFGVGLAVAVIVWLLELLLAGLAIAGLAAAVAHGQGWMSLLNEDPTQLLRRLMIWAPLWLVVGGVLGAAIYAVMIAPWAEIYRELAADWVAPRSRP